MATRLDLRNWIIEALQALGGRGTPIEVSRVIWERHEADLRRSGNLFYDWQYQLRWAATALRAEGTLKKTRGDRTWELS
ncbi:MAG: hypothetical protein KatS3mg060_0299 [Dehalococcoidia bacterium]|nr:MAG: hypothetical protein KatS3mg060_0299 [Dehalococcoidia bacterium]